MRTQATILVQAQIFRPHACARMSAHAERRIGTLRFSLERQSSRRQIRSDAASWRETIPLAPSDRIGQQVRRRSLFA